MAIQPHQLKRYDEVVLIGIEKYIDKVLSNYDTMVDQRRSWDTNPHFRFVFVKLDAPTEKKLVRLYERAGWRVETKPYGKDRFSFFLYLDKQDSLPDEN